MEVKNKALKSKYPEFASNMKQKGINKLQKTTGFLMMSVGNKSKLI